MSTGNVRHEFGKTPAGQELLLLFGAKRSPQDELQRAKAHEIKELEQDKSELQSQVSNLEHDLETNLIAKGKLEQDKPVLQLEVLSLKDSLDSIQEGKEGLEQKNASKYCVQLTTGRNHPRGKERRF